MGRAGGSLAAADQWLHSRINAAQPFSRSWKVYNAAHRCVHELAYLLRQREMSNGAVYLTIALQVALVIGLGVWMS